MRLRIRELRIRGVIISGRGEGAKYVKRNYYHSLLRSLLGYEPYPGTLNVDLLEPCRDYQELLAMCRPCLVMETLRLHNKVLGGLIAWYGRFMDTECIVLRPLLSKHPRSVIEVVAPLHLRSVYGLNDGDVVEVIIYCP